MMAMKISNASENAKVTANHCWNEKKNQTEKVTGNSRWNVMEISNLIENEIETWIGTSILKPMVIGNLTLNQMKIQNVNANSKKMETVIVNPTVT